MAVVAITIYRLARLAQGDVTLTIESNESPIESWKMTSGLDDNGKVTLCAFREIPAFNDRQHPLAMNSMNQTQWIYMK